MSQEAQIRFALNHMAAPQLDLPAFFRLARSLDISEVEIRNDIAGKPILDGMSAAEVRALAAREGVAIISINALQRFNDWTEAREREAVELADYARDCGAKALILVPVNDGSGRGAHERQGNAEQGLHGLKPILQARGIIGLVEPLGFEVCSLRSKREAVAAIRAVGGENAFKITHDTFHHHLAGEPEIFPEVTGLVHISGVSDPHVSVCEMRDSHRVLVDAGDRLGNLEQIRALRGAGYSGPFSFEPFAEELKAVKDPAAALAASMRHIEEGLKARVA